MEGPLHNTGHYTKSDLYVSPVVPYPEPLPVFPLAHPSEPSQPLSCSSGPGLLFKLPFLSFLAPGRSTFPGNQLPLPAEVKSLSAPLPTRAVLLYIIVILRLGYYSMLLD